MEYEVVQLEEKLVVGISSEQETMIQIWDK